MSYQVQVQVQVHVISPKRGYTNKKQINKDTN